MHVDKVNPKSCSAYDWISVQKLGSYATGGLNPAETSEHMWGSSDGQKSRAWGERRFLGCSQRVFTPSMSSVICADFTNGH